MEGMDDMLIIASCNEEIASELDHISEASTYLRR